MPKRVCCNSQQVHSQCNAQGPLSKLERAAPQRQINVTSTSPIGDISIVTLVRTDTTLDHSRKAEKVRESKLREHTHLTAESVGILRSRKNLISHIDASLSRQPLVKGERLVRYEVNAVMLT